MLGEAIHDADARLVSEGLDSLGAVELRNLLQSQMGDVALPSSLVADNPTLRALDGAVNRMLASGGALDAEEQAIDERERVLIAERARRRGRAALR